MTYDLSRHRICRMARELGVAGCIGVLVALAGAPLLAQATQRGPEAQWHAWTVNRELARQSPFADLVWQRLGPKFTGGRIESIEALPGDLSTLYVGAGSGGVWKTTNGGLTWRPIFEDQPTFAVGDLAIAPSQPDTLWLGTGECHIGRNSYSGLGVFKSTDGGDSWQSMGLRNTYHIGQIAIDPQDPDHVLVAAMGQRRQGGQRGIYRSRDGGQHFEQVLFAGEQVAFVDLIFDPLNPRRLFASSWDRGGGNGSGVYRSDDAGASWQRLGGGLPDSDIDRVAIAISASQPNVVYALMADRSSPQLERRQPAAILFRSADGGQTWQRTHEGYVPTYIGWDFCDLRVAPDDPNRLYIGGFRFITSADGGQTFAGEGGLAPNTTRENVFRLHAHQGLGLHLDVHDIWIDPQHPERVLLGNDGGLFQSLDRGQTWLHLNNLPIAEFYRVYLDDERPFRIWAGTQDNASVVGPHTARLSPGEDDLWQHVFLDPWTGGDGFATFPDPQDASIVYFTQQNGDLKRARFGVLDSGRSIRPRPAPGQSALQWAWDTPFFASSHPGPTTLYCAAQRVLRSTDRGRSWTAISPDLASAGPLWALAESPLDPQRLVVADGQGQVHVTQDGGQNWTKAAELPPIRARNVVASAHDPDRIYAVLSGRLEEDTTPYVFVSHDFGKTWESLAANLPAESTNAICEDAATPGLLFLGTDRSVYASIDGGKAWVSLANSLPTAAVVDVKVHPRDGALVAATHGLSLFLLDIAPIREAADRDPPER